MERTQSQSESESAVIKAAAWAWYQHGSGSEGKPEREFDILSTRRAPGPSRYKLEARRLADNETETKDGSSSRLSSINLSPSHIDNTLLDPYEVGRISKHLEYLVESSSGSYYRESHASGGGNRDHQTDGSSSPESRKKKSMRLNAFLLRHSRICGGRQNVGAEPAEAETVWFGRWVGQVQPTSQRCQVKWHYWSSDLLHNIIGASPSLNVLGKEFSQKGHFHSCLYLLKFTGVI